MNYFTLAEIEAHDTRPISLGKNEFRYLCCLSESCRNKPLDAAHRSLCLNLGTGAFFCHRCQRKGKLREFWTKNVGAVKSREKSGFNPRAKARIVLQEKFKVALAKVKKETQPLDKLDRLSEQMRQWQLKFAGSPAQNYLQKRGVAIETAREFGCGYAAQWEHWEKREDQWFLVGTDERVIFPVTDKTGKLVAVQARAINNRFIGAEKLTKGDKSLGLFQPMKVFKHRVVAITEGPVDALALGTCGVAATAMIGSSFPAWLPIACGFKSILIATDADEAGDTAATKLQTELAARGAHVFRLRPRSAKDWAEVLEEVGKRKLAAHLAPFARTATDETRINKAWKWFQDNRKAAAHFTAKLIEDPECREWLLDKFRAFETA